MAIGSNCLQENRMRTCPAPNGSRLPESQRAGLGRIVQTLAEAGFRESRIKPQLPALVGELEAVCRTDDDLRAWCDELRLWVRWYRVPAYWLTFVFQVFTKSRGSTWHFLACDLYADAQASFADDLAVSSLETAYVGYARHAETLGPTFEPVGRAIRDKLRQLLEMHATWLRPFEYREANPLADHHCFALAHTELAAQAQAMDLSLDGEVDTRVSPSSSPSQAATMAPGRASSPAASSLCCTRRTTAPLRVLPSPRWPSPKHARTGSTPRSATSFDCTGRLFAASDDWPNRCTTSSRRSTTSGSSLRISTRSTGRRSRPTSSATPCCVWPGRRTTGRSTRPRAPLWFAPIPRGCGRRSLLTTMGGCI